MPGRRRPKTFLEEVAAAEEVAPKDFDPEDIRDSSDDEFDGSDSETEGRGHAREHYVDVGKSKIRKRDVAPLGPQYRGVRVGREALGDEDSDDPFSKEINVDESSSEDEGATRRNRTLLKTANGTGEVIDGPDVEDDSSSVVQDEVDEEEDSASGVDSEVESDEEEEVDEESDEEDDHQDKTDDRAELRRMMKEDAKGVTDNLARSLMGDVEKGEAVRVQRKAFDALLNTRIRLQKSLISSNTLSTRTDKIEDGNLQEAQKTLRSAEQAALNLLNNLNSLRTSLESARTGTKRKHQDELSLDTPSATIWATLRSSEKEALAHRHSALNKWSQKSRPTTVAARSQKLVAASQDPQQSLSSVLASQLADPTRLIARTQTPRSCAPGATRPSPAVYDDADFYGVLLKELLERRSGELGNPDAALAFDTTTTAAAAAARASKVRRQVDTRASKGRKLRYTVHEKLQNFMAPEDRCAWGERQADELFGSLFGRKMGLEENVDEDMEESDDAESPQGEEKALRLFRS